MSEKTLTPIGAHKQIRPVFIVAADGRIEHHIVQRHSGSARFAPGSNGRRLSERSVELGYVFLKDAYAQDSREDVREQGFAEYSKYVAHVRANRWPKETLRIPLGNGEFTTESRLVEFPEYWLPELVMERRAGRAETVVGNLAAVPAVPGGAAA